MMNHHKPFPKLFFGFLIIGIFHNAIRNGADFLASWLVVMPDTLRAEYGVDYIDIAAHRNRIIWAFGQAHITVCAFMCN